MRHQLTDLDSISANALVYLCRGTTTTQRVSLEICRSHDSVHPAERLELPIERLGVAEEPGRRLRGQAPPQSVRMRSVVPSQFACSSFHDANVRRSGALSS